MSKSNLNGRAFEFFLTKRIIEKSYDIYPLGDTLVIQNRDFKKIEILDNKLKILFNKASLVIYNWLITQIDIKTIERFHDSAGKQSDVTDIQLSDNTLKFNISVKSNHMAIKHQRPGSLIQQFGIPKGAIEDIMYRNEYKEINQNFHTILKRINPNAKYFNEVEEIKNTYIYEPICKKVAEKINIFGADTHCSSFFQSFLIGKTDFIKVIAYYNKVVILQFNNLPKTPKMTADIYSSNYVNVNFHNGIKVKMRLHTASSRITSNLSLKFDSQLSEDVIVPKIELPLL
jgi:hypothetical protein